MNSVLLRLRTWWETADRTQKVVTIFGSIFLVFLLAGTFYFAGRPKMVVAYGGLDVADQGRVIAEIQRLGIPVEYDVQGNVKVPSDKVAEVQATLARTGMNPTSGTVGNEALSQMGIMSPKEVIEKQLQGVLQSQIEAALEDVNGVQDARVLLNLGYRGGFGADDEPPSASVTVTEDAGADLVGAPAKSLAQLVSRAVTGLSVKNVSIVNQDGLALFDGSETEGVSAQSSTKIAAQIAEAKRIKRELQPLLDRFGIGNTILTVRVEMDFDKETKRSTTITPKDAPISKTTVDETMVGGAGTSGITGNAANTSAPAASSGADGAGKNYKGNQSSLDYPYDTVITDSEKAPGTITSIYISALVNSDAPEGKEAIDPVAVEDAIKGFVGESPANRSYNVKVTTAKFDNSAQKSIQDAASAAAGRDRTQQIMSLIPVGALILVAFLVMKSLKKVATANNVVMHALPDGRMVAIPASNSKALPASVAAMIEEEEWEEVEEANPEAPEGPPIRKKRKKKRPMVDEEEDDDSPHVRVGRINEKVNVPLEQLKKMANDRPDSIAMLLKSWLVEERR